MSEFEELAASSLKDARFGSFLVIPLKWENTVPLTGDLGAPIPISTVDMTESVKKMFNREDGYRLGSRYRISRDAVLKKLLPSSSLQPKDFAVLPVKVEANGSHRLDSCSLYDSLPESAQHFTIHSAWLYLYRTRVAFLCFEIHYRDMTLMQEISGLGYADLCSNYFVCYEDGSCAPFAFDQALTELCRSLGFEGFAARETSPLMEAFLYNVSVSRERFRELETCRQISLNQHLMGRIDLPLRDDSEEDIHYLYSVKDQDFDSYRWGSCVTSQTISYAVGRSDIDLDDEMQQHAEDGLPLVTLALYQKYSCLVFSDEILSIDKFNMKKLNRLKRTLIEFKAFGVVDPAMLSRWYNVRQTYGYLLAYNGVAKAIDSVDEKISILADHQASIRAQRSNTVMGLITLFGIVSILASILDIISFLRDGGTVFWNVGLWSLAIMVVATALALIRNTKSN